MALSSRQEAFVSAYLGAARGIGSLAAKMAGYRGNDRTLRVTASDLLTNPNVAAALAEGRARVRAEGIACLENRLAAQNERWLAIHKVIAERADAYGYTGAIPGGDTGLVTRQVRGIGRGGDFQQVDEYVADTALLAELRALEQHTAKELGQWEDRSSVNLVEHPEFVDARRRIAAALAAYPEAAEAVERALADAGR